MKLCNEQLRVKEKDGYLGDILHEKGLSRSVKETVNKRYGRTFAAIVEVKSILEDYRIDSLGGLKTGLDIFELAVMPSLLHNADTWVEIDIETQNKLEKLQNTMFRYLFGALESTPKAILRYDFGHFSMKEKVHIKKLNLLNHLKRVQKSDQNLWIT